MNTPELQQAHNDYAVGLLVQTVANSPYAKDTLIIIIEDDSQDGADHVDSHRATTYFVGPYVKHGAVVSTRYSQPNVLRTIEDIFGTEHLNLNTYYARPMANLFNIKSSGNWTFSAVASQLLNPLLTTPTSMGGLGLDPKTVQFASGPNLNQLMTRSTGRREPAASISREKAAFRPTLQQDPLGRSQRNACSSNQNAVREDRRRRGRAIGCIHSQIGGTQEVPPFLFALFLCRKSCAQPEPVSCGKYIAARLHSSWIGIWL